MVSHRVHFWVPFYSLSASSPLVSSSANVYFYSYADGTQLCILMTGPICCDTVTLHRCLAEIIYWMSDNFLQLNHTKMDVIVLSPSAYRTQILANLGELATFARNLGLLFELDLCFEPHVKKVVQSCFLSFFIRNIAMVRFFISAPDLAKFIHAFISFCLDYWNSLYTGLSQKSIHRLQLIQSAAARLFTQSKNVTTSPLF